MPADWSRFKLGNVPLCSCFPAVLLVVCLLASCRVHFMEGQVTIKGRWSLVSLTA